MQPTKKSKGQRELTPYVEQEPFVQSKKYATAFVSGVGAGKTVAGIIRMLANMEGWNAGETGMILLPNLSNWKDVIMPELENLGVMDYYEYNGPGSRSPGLVAPNGSRAIIKTASNDREANSIRGPSLSWVWIDEARDVPHLAYKIANDRLRAGGYENIFLTTTPNGYDWIYNEFGDIDGETYRVGDATVHETADTLAVLGVPTDSNPHTGEKYKARQNELTGAYAAQEVRGEFTSFEGLIYDWFDRERHVYSQDAILSELTRETPDGGIVWDTDRWLFGLDFGFSSSPDAAIAIAVKDEHIYVVDEFSVTGQQEDELVARLDAMQDRWLNGPVYADAAEPRLIESLNRAGVETHAAEKDVHAGIRNVSKYREKLAVSEECDELINEFGLYRYRDGKDEPLKQNDHLLDALRYALMSGLVDGGHSVSVIGADLQNRS